MLFESAKIRKILVQNGFGEENFVEKGHKKRRGMARLYNQSYGLLDLKFSVSPTPPLLVIPMLNIVLFHIANKANAFPSIFFILTL